MITVPGEENVCFVAQVVVFLVIKLLVPEDINIWKQQIKRTVFRHYCRNMRMTLGVLGMGEVTVG